MKASNQNKGLTLIELLAVLVILVAVAGTLVPLIPDVTRQSHGASGADNIKEITKSLQLYRQLNGSSYPDDMDSLIEDASTTAFDGLELGLTPPLAPVSLAGGAGTLGARIVDALNSAGIDTVRTHLPDTDANYNATFSSTANSVSVDASATLMQLTSDGISQLGLQAIGTNGAYIALGVGNDNSAIGNTMVDAPVHFLESAGESPAEVYARWLAIFSIPSTDGAATLVSVASLDEGTLAGIGKHIEEYYE